MKRGLQVKSARDLGPQFTDNPHRMVGQDGAYSIPLGEDVLWFFGDTLIGKRVPGESLWYPGGKPVGPEDMTGRGSIERMLNNCGLLLSLKTGRHGLKPYHYLTDDQGQLLQLIPRLPDEHPDEIRIWCMHGCMIDTRIYLYYIRVRMLPSGVLPVNFDIIGTGLAVGSRDNWKFQRISAKDSTLWWGADMPQFGSAVLLQPEEGYVYLYGVRRDKQGIQQCHLARVLIEKIESLDAYEYLKSEKPIWSSDPGLAAPLFSGIPNEMSVSWNPFLQCYLAVHSLDLTGKIVARIAPTPWGPWSDPVELWKVVVQHEKPIPYPTLIYAGKEHPELAEDGGRVLYITYIEFEEYFPHLVEITLDRTSAE